MYPTLLANCSSIRFKEAPIGLHGSFEVNRSCFGDCLIVSPLLECIICTHDTGKISYGLSFRPNYVDLLRTSIQRVLTFKCSCLRVFFVPKLEDVFVQHDLFISLPCLSLIEV